MNDYKFSIKGSNEHFSKYTTEGAKLELEDDAAHINMGGNWHMPSPTQINELINNTTSTWATQDGVNGRLFTSKKNGSKSIFIPAVGRASDGSIRSSDYSLVWSSMVSVEYFSYGQNLCCNSGKVYLDYYFRYYGMSVRGVIG